MHMTVLYRGRLLPQPSDLIPTLDVAYGVEPVPTVDVLTVFVAMLFCLTLEL